MIGKLAARFIAGVAAALVVVLIGPTANAYASIDSGYAGWTRGFDFSDSKPTPAQVRAAGGSFVMVYISPTYTAGKYSSAAQIAAFRADGIGVGLIYETTATRVLGGCAAGTTDGIRTRAARTHVGAPQTTPVYGVAVDFAVTTAQYATVDAYADCYADQVGGKGLAGVYARGDYITHAAIRGYTRLWQTYAWSSGVWSPFAALRQVHNGWAVSGRDTDLDFSLDPSRIVLIGATSYPKREAVDVPPARTAPVAPKPATVTPAATYRVRAGDTLAKIGARTGRDWRTIASCNGIRSPYTIYPGRVLKLSCSAAPAAAVTRARYVVVRSGDTLSKIASRNGSTWQRLYSLNRGSISNPNRIRVGQRIRIT